MRTTILAYVIALAGLVMIEHRFATTLFAALTGSIVVIARRI
jgi:hypothetical protein